MDGVAVKSLVPFGEAAEAEFFFDQLASGAAELFSLRWILQQFVEALNQALLVANGNQKASLSVFDAFGGAANVMHDGGQFHRLGFEQDARQTLVMAGRKSQD